MKIVYNKIIPFPGYKFINLFGILFAHKGVKIKEQDITHESIHTKQMKELLYVGFYLAYMFEYLGKSIWYRNFKKAYKNLSFEKEAYEHQDDPEYLKTRKHYAQWRT